MNTKPRAKKFRVRKSLGLAERTTASGVPVPEPAKAAGTGNSAPVTSKTDAQSVSKTAGAAPRTDPGAGSGETDMPPAPGNGTAKPLAPMPKTGEPTARQMRLARRLATRRGIKANTDAEAVAALRAQGVDPFGKNRLQIVPPKTACRR
jgi:capsular polysaccharide transport system permease protein